MTRLGEHLIDHDYRLALFTLVDDAHLRRRIEDRARQDLVGESISRAIAPQGRARHQKRPMSGAAGFR
jgi:hypothetical protein